MIKNMVVSQHFGVVTRRYDAKRIRIVLEEDGLDPLVKKHWKPAPTPDRLETMLSLLQGCGVIRSEDEGQMALAFD